jgi:hypothetical protein
MSQLTEFDKDIRILRRKIERHESAENLIAFYGSSTIRLWLNMKEDLAPLNVMNLGFGGSNFDACIYYFDQVFHGLYPKQIVLYGGDNDLSLGYDAQTIHDRFIDLTQVIRSKYPNVFLYGITIKPSPHREESLPIIKEANRLMKRSIAELGNATQIDTYSALIGHDGKPQPDLYLADGLHLGKSGYEQWSKAVKNILL